MHRIREKWHKGVKESNKGKNKTIHESCSQRNGEADHGLVLSHALSFKSCIMASCSKITQTNKTSKPNRIHYDTKHACKWVWSWESSVTYIANVQEQQNSELLRHMFTGFV